MRPQSWINFTRVRGLLVWALVLPAVLAEETATESAGVSRPGPDQEIVDIVSVKDAPPIAGTNIHHQGHAHEHLQVEADEIGSIIQRSSISSSFPTAFDTSLSKNFTTESCPSFFKNFLADPSFTDCHALSTLLRDSTGFFHTLRTAASTSLVLDTACSADVSSCSSTMSSFASDLLADDNCGQDYEAGNPLVANAYYDMITYEPTYRATCLQNPDTSDYCFVDAVTNSSNPVDYDIYFLPYGSTIDSKSTPTCGPCLQATLDIFSEWAQVKDQPLADSYIPSAKAVNGKCGADFAKVNITVGEEDDIPSAAASQRAISFPFWVSLTVGAVLVSL